MTEQFMTPEETDRYIIDLIRRVTGQRKSGVLHRVWGLVIGALWLTLIGLVIAVFAFALRVQYGMPIPIPDSLVATAAVTFSTAAAPLPTAQIQQRREPPALPVAGAAPWPTLTPTQVPVIAPAPLPTPLAHLVLSKPADNPGFDSQVEPGNQPTPVVGLVDPEDAPPVELYGVKDRSFAPAALPTSSAADNPGFDSGVEPGNEPTPVQ